MWMFYLDFVVDDLLGGATRGATGDFDIVPRERRLIGVLVCECVVGRRPRIVVVRGKRNDQNSRRVVREGSRDEDGEHGSHGFVFLCCSRMASIFIWFYDGKSIVSHTVRCGRITNNTWMLFGEIDLALLTVVFADGQRRFDPSMELALGEIVQVLVVNFGVPIAVGLVPS